MVCIFTFRLSSIHYQCYRKKKCRQLGRQGGSDLNLTPAINVLLYNDESTTTVLYNTFSFGFKRIIDYSGLP